MAKVMVSLPDDFLARVDSVAAARGLTRSALVRHALVRELTEVDLQRRQTALVELRNQFARMPAFDAVRAVRLERDR